MEGEDNAFPTTAYAPTTNQPAQNVHRRPRKKIPQRLKRFLDKQQKFTTPGEENIEHEQSVALFPDLHTHLLGMGDAKFWKKVITEVIPELLDVALDDDDRWNECLKGRPADSSFAQLDQVAASLKVPKKSTFRQQVEEKKGEEPTASFTFDVVYSVQTLCRAIGQCDDLLDKKSPSEAELLLMRGWVLQQLGSDRQTNNGFDANDEFEWFWVFNAQLQEFERRYGITNTSLVEWCLDDEHNLRIVDSFFELPRTTGKSSKNHFSPELHRHRYCMKQAMYSQYPIVLDILLRCVLNDYAAAGVNYVEFSVDFSDLVERPWMFVHLSAPTTQHPLQFGNWIVPPLHRRVTFRYLAEIDRRNVHDLCRLNPRNSVDEVAHAADLMFDRKTSAVKPKYFERHIERLKMLKQKFAESRRSNVGGSIRRLHEMCVGLDYFGHELFHPHCSFAVDKLVNFLLQERVSRNDRFGFRIHAGQLLHLEEMPQALMVVHMGVLLRAICRILHKYETWWKSIKENSLKPMPTDCPPPLRIAHGTAFLPFLLNQDASHQLLQQTSSHPAVGNYRNTILAALKKIRELRIPIEVCPSSVEHLEDRSSRSNPVQTFLKKGFCVVVCSDNEYGRCSRPVAAELVRAVSEPRRLQDHSVKSLLDNYKHAAFGCCHEDVHRLVLLHPVRKKRRSARAKQTDGEPVGDSFVCVSSNIGLALH